MPKFSANGQESKASNKFWCSFFSLNGRPVTVILVKVLRYSSLCSGSGVATPQCLVKCCQEGPLGVSYCSVLEGSIPKALAFAFGLRLRSQMRYFQTRVLLGVVLPHLPVGKKILRFCLVKID